MFVWFCLDSYTCWFCGTIHAANCARGFPSVWGKPPNPVILGYGLRGSKNHASGFFRLRNSHGTVAEKQCYKPPISKWFIPSIYIYLWCSREWFVSVLPTWISIRFNATEMLFLNSTCPSIFVCWHHSIPFCCTVSKNLISFCCLKSKCWTNLINLFMMCPCRPTYGCVLVYKKFMPTHHQHITNWYRFVLKYPYYTKFGLYNKL